MSTQSTPAAPSPVVLVIDDEPDVRTAVEMVLRYEGFDVWTAKTGQEGLDRLDEEAGRGQRAAAILCDVKMPGMDGLEVLSHVLERADAPPILMISGHADISTAVEAVKRGAADFLEKPLEGHRLVVSLRSAMATKRLVRENTALRRELGGSFTPIGKSPTWKALMEQVERAAGADVPVLLLGENGTGKEVVARHLHLCCDRADGPFVPVNCAAIPEQLIESELFGHEKGAFTGAHEKRIGHFEAAGGGTLFLDEIGDMPLDAQAKVLRALESREISRVGGSGVSKVDIRVIAATNADLAAAVEAKTFRMDLFYRLNVVPLRLPPLRERAEDIPALAAHFLDQIARRQGRKALGLSHEALTFLRSQPFPGNVRQLRNLLEGAQVFCDGERLERADLERLLGDGPALSVGSTSVGGDSGVFASETFEQFKHDSEALFFKTKLELNSGNVKRTAEELGMQRSHLYKKLDRYGLR